MIVYEAALFDKQEQLGDPEKGLGLFVTLEAAQAVAADERDYLDQEPLVNVYEPQGEELKVVGIWWEDRSGPAPVWKYRQED